MERGNCQWFIRLDLELATWFMFKVRYLFVSDSSYINKKFAYSTTGLITLFKAQIPKY